MRADRKLVVDTNLWISRLLMPGGTAAKAVDHGLAWGIPLMSEETLTELSDVLSRSKFDKYVSREDRQQFLRLLGGIVRIVHITQRIAACRDPKDDKFLDVALNGGAQVILTGDQDLLELHPFHGLEILRPADFLDWPID
ncbi:putative toxin-antitoxin system toxin component, PIN family [Pseudoxanthomonas sp. JBR18]|uniref:putative toxin-antitoxin system toxin component, PIN family n=1 Tax=Pseudoxanthomonas sp. JBR18 TaxID=2969308 RepID=UPI0023056D1E|nr:putative toxin-antitoxin system toxin component, PIN family [Pseudoxanthomonas sp. JBR18]WCE03588.1 putative toxin-antitoxin system toxin component, PIN family [Pseudoxanthomonas sp. JBR18]